MAKLKDLMRGRKARRTVPFPMPIGTDGPGIEVDLLVLDGDKEEGVLVAARADAISRGVAEPKLGEPIYDLRLMLHTLLASCVDRDSPPDAPAPFFASVEEILGALDRERIAHLYALQQVWQESLAPTKRENLTDERVLEICLEAADEEDSLRFFEKLQPVTLARCFHFSARQLRNLLLIRSGYGSSSPSVGATESTRSDEGASETAAP